MFGRRRSAGDRDRGRGARRRRTWRPRPRPTTAGERGPRGRPVGRGRAAPGAAPGRPRQPAGPGARGDGHPAGVRRAARRLGDGAPRAQRAAAAGVRRAQAGLAVGRRARRDRGEIAGAGGQATEREGPFGTELLGHVPASRASPPPGMRPVRFVGVDGPRWFLRGVFSGRGGGGPRGGAPLEAVIREVVVVRGDHPVPPRDLLELRLPPRRPAAIEEQARRSRAAGAEQLRHRSPARSSAARRSPRPASLPVPAGSCGGAGTSSPAVAALIVGRTAREHTATDGARTAKHPRTGLGRGKGAGCVRRPLAGPRAASPSRRSP